MTRITYDVILSSPNIDTTTSIIVTTPEGETEATRIAEFVRNREWPHASHGPWSVCKITARRGAVF